MAYILKDILGNNGFTLTGNAETSINEIQIDSRSVKEDDVFVAIKGHSVDGHNYITKAIENGATVIVCETLPEHLEEEVTYIKVESSTTFLGVMTSNYYGNPSSKLKLIGVTGTNGKTTVATLLYQLFKDLGYKVGLLSTVENKIGDEVIPSTHTTPNNIALNALLSKMVDAGCEYAFMEVSSHAIHQERIAGVQFVGGLFTNISHDHLDYHETFKEYIWTKKKFFDDLDKSSFVVTNIDDKRGEVMVQNTKASIKTYGLQRMADYKGRVLSNTIHGLTLRINDQEVAFRLVGEFNAYNLLVVYATGIELGIDNFELLTAMSNLTGAEGRFERVSVDGCGVTGIVDYAHTPDALENVLQTIQKTAKASSKIITVVGCGGDRDKTKRPLMAKIGVKLSNVCVLTSDNPRTENPESILDDMEAGLERSQLQGSLRITDRTQAIKTAVRLADENDIILVAGKGHEKYQDINGVKTLFDDKEVLKSCLEARLG